MRSKRQVRIKSCRVFRIQSDTIKLQILLAKTKRKSLELPVEVDIIYIFFFSFFVCGFCSCSMQALQLWHVSSVVVAHRWLSCSVACGILVPRPGIEPMSPALEGGFLTIGPPGESLIYILRRIFWQLCGILSYKQEKNKEII